MTSHDLERLTLEVEESDVVVQAVDGEEVTEDLNLCLVGRFLTDRPYGRCVAFVGGSCYQRIGTRSFPFPILPSSGCSEGIEGWSLDF